MQSDMFLRYSTLFVDVPSTAPKAKWLLTANANTNYLDRFISHIANTRLLGIFLICFHKLFPGKYWKTLWRGCYKNDKVLFCMQDQIWTLNSRVLFNFLFNIFVFELVDNTDGFRKMFDSWDLPTLTEYYF